MKRSISFILFFCSLSFITIAQPKWEKGNAANSDSVIKAISVSKGAPGETDEIEFEEDYEEGEYSDDYEDEYNDNYEDEEYDEYLRTIDSAKWAKTKLDKRFIYKKEKPKKEKKKRKPLNFGNFFNADAVKIVLYFLFGGFLLFIIYLFFKNNNLSFRRNVKDEKIVQEDPWEDVQNFEDWELALQAALRDENYRLATRIYYLQTLNKLSQAQLTTYRQDKTNWHYVQKLFGTAYHDDFKDLTTSFDYIWYGEYELSTEQFEQLESQFKNFHNKITL